MGLGLNSAIHIAHMGMGAAEKTLNVSGDNLANANTTGYKAERADFSSFLAYNYRYGSTPNAGNTAGTNPQQIGMGVELASVTTDFTQGAFKEGMSNSDIAINGTGFLVVQDAYNSQQYYTRDGVLKINENSDLTTNTGLYVMGYGINDKFQIQTDKLTNIRIPINEMHIAEQTTTTTIAGILDAVGTTGTQGTVLQTPQMTDLSKTGPGNQKATTTQVISPIVEGVTQINGTSTADGAVSEGKYQYRFVYADANGVESDYSTTLNAEVTSGQNALTLTNLPTVPDDYSTLRIYRADDPGNPNVKPTYNLVSEIDPSTTTPPNTFVDTASSASIASNPQLDQGRLQQGTYQYYVTYIDDYGNESRPSAISDPFSIGGVNGEGGGQVQLSDIPAVDADDNPDNWTGRRIYRSTANDSTNFYLVDEIRNNMDPDLTVIDRISDASLTDGTHMEISEAGRGDVLITESSKLVDIGKFESNRFVTVFEEGTLTLTPNRGGEELKVQTLEITSETTVGDYMRFLNESFGIRTPADGVQADQGTLGQTINNGTQGATVIDGALYFLGNAGEKNALVIDASDMTLTPKTEPGETQKDSYRVNLNWGQDQNNKQDAIGSSVQSDLQVYDSLGTAVNVRMTMVLESKSNNETVYRWYADSSDNQPADGSAIATGTGTLRFDSYGKLIGASNTTISVERTSVASVSPLDFQFDMNVDALMALATGTPQISQTEWDGAPAGTLYDYEIQADGTVLGIFTGGTERALGQIVLATFRNEEGLYKSGNSLYQESTNSGQAVISTPGSGAVGKIKSNALELSNTDIGQEIVDMILASAMYRANAKVMTTSNEMYDALLRIV